MTDSAFEMRLERAARRYADEAVRPFDAVALADAAMRGVDRPRAGRGWDARRSRARGIIVAFATETRNRYGWMGHSPGGNVRSWMPLTPPRLMNAIGSWKLLCAF